MRVPSSPPRFPVAKGGSTAASVTAELRRRRSPVALGGSHPHTATGEDAPVDGAGARLDIMVR
ncbi:hypothetical protein DEA06_01120 [Microbacterium sp. Gd 4-13]|uniref:hypothetical protein n=1 Tax=Microbacterium sp. Gd 4-13 TaxID=2173179 RepID=UPI000D5848B8|nr:hypothetical protein [Microbacterium sp. Gd 4-13]PVW06184.1 hypothetical protein DEA06_01120 [Microbacterium sp. Gd 4-13]